MPLEYRLFASVAKVRAAVASMLGTSLQWKPDGACIRGLCVTPKVRDISNLPGILSRLRPHLKSRIINKGASVIDERAFLTMSFRFMLLLRAIESLFTDTVEPALSSLSAASRTDMESELALEMRPSQNCNNARGWPIEVRLLGPCS